jgi:L-threonylcarbamoyladenylate synthase
MPPVLKVEPPSYSSGSIRQAAAVLRSGGIAVFPTETVYGVGADIRNPAAVERVFVVKGRRRSLPLMAHCASLVQMHEYVAETPCWVQPLVNRFWPGPLALVFRSTHKVPPAVTGGGPTLGVRMVEHPVARDLIEELGAPIAGTSANLGGEPATSRFATVSRILLERVDVALDAGLCGKYEPSTVLDVTSRPPRLVRQGAVSVQDIEAIVGHVSRPQSPAASA